MPPHHARTRVADLRFHLFERSIHPELVDMLRRAELRESAYQATIAITGQSHLISVRCEGETLSEVVAPLGAPLPTVGVRAAAPLQPGIRDDVLRIEGALHYRASLRVVAFEAAGYRMLAEKLLSEDRLDRLKVFFDDDSQMPADREIADQSPFALVDFRPRRRRIDVTSIHADPHARTIVQVETRIDVAPGR